MSTTNETVQLFLLILNNVSTVSICADFPMQDRRGSFTGQPCRDY